VASRASTLPWRVSDASAPGEHFDAQHLTTDASINRLIIAPSGAVPARLAGHEAYAILSADAVAKVATSHGVSVARDAIADDLNVALRQGGRRGRPAAEAVAAEVGLRLACLLATLRRPDTAAEQGWSPWRRAYLRHWANLDEVHLAGGLLTGVFGRVVADETNAALARDGVRSRAALMPWPAWAALIGAARRLGLDAGKAVAVDLGGSRAKTAVVRVLPGGLVELAHPITTRLGFGPTDQPPRETLEDLLAGILGSAARYARSLGADVRAVAISVACYLDQNVRCASRGAYANLPDLRDDSWRRRLEALYDRPVDLGVFHDGTAAAASMSSSDRADATLVLGTAIGVGFRPPGLPDWSRLTVQPRSPNL
jgi:hypothetical protein